MWYNIFMKTINRNNHYTPIQMRIQVDLEKIIENSDPIYTFNEIMEQIDLYKYFAEKGSKTGRPIFDSVKLLKIILFAFMKNGYASVGNIENMRFALKFAVMRETDIPRRIMMLRLCESKEIIWAMTNCCRRTMSGLEYAMST